MKETASIIVRDFGGHMPENRAELLKLPGIGSYTAGAVLSIAYHLPEPLVDGNVLRVLSRLFLSENDIALPATKKDFEDLLGGFLLNNDVDPSAFNQALMELGALVCVPNGTPKCEECPWREECRTHLKNETDRIPVKSPKKARKTEQKTVFFIRAGKSLLVRKNGENGLLQGLYGWPMAEGFLSEQETETEVINILQNMSSKATETKILSIHPLPEKKHVFTHLEWQMKAYLVDVQDVPQICGEAVFLPFDKIRQSIPMPSAMKKWDGYLGEL